VSADQPTIATAKRLTATHITQWIYYQIFVAR